MHLRRSVPNALAGFLLLATPAFAADGEILIDQAKVNAGGITPGDDPGFPATLSKSGRYKLTDNLRVPAGETGIFILQSDITVDFNGFTLRSSPPGQAQTGINVRADRIRVANGTIVGFAGVGIHLEGRFFAVIENMRILSSGSIAVSSGREARIRNNTIAGNSIGISDCRGCLIEQNIVTGSAFHGISVSGGVVVGNVIADNAQHGLRGTATSLPGSGYANNILVGNNGGGAQVFSNVFQLHPNVCEPACP